MQFEYSFRAMDTDVDIVVAGAGGLPPAGVFTGVGQLFEEQEERFSRFRESSLLSTLNRAEEVRDPQFVEVCELALAAWEATGGLFNPMVLPALEEAGYRGSFATVAGGSPRRQSVPQLPDCLERTAEGVRLRLGRLDLGGIVKGWTVDLAAELLRRDCPNFLVNAGGDLRCEGSEAGGDGWNIAIEGPDGTIAWEGTITGALATSTTVRRRWGASDGASAHHLIDPRTGTPADAGYVHVSARASECWQAEVWAKATLIGGAATAEAAAEAGIWTVVWDGSGRMLERGP